MQNSIKRAEQLTKKLQSKTKKVYRKYTTKKHRHKTIITIVSLVSILLVLVLSQMYLAQARRSDKVLELRQQYETKVKVESELKVELRNQLKLQKVYEKKLATKKKQLKTLKANKALERAEAEKAVQTTTPTVETPQQAPVQATGCDSLRSRLSNLGISGAELDSAIILASRESGCSSLAVNPSGACGEFQSLPCGKWGSPGTDQYLQGAIAYVNSVYGGFVNALNHSYTYNWY